MFRDFDGERRLTEVKQVAINHLRIGDSLLFDVDDASLEVGVFLFLQEVIKQVGKQLPGLHLCPGVGPLVGRKAVVDIGTEEFREWILGTADSLYSFASLYSAR